MNKKIRAGTRGSLLSLKQTELVIESLKKITEWEFEIVKIKTKGDKITDSPLYKIPGKGFFIKEIEDELIKANIDIAVHSMKDLPTELPKGLEIAAVLKRDPPNDATLGLTIDEILELVNTKTKKIKIGTSSLRRQAQIKNILKTNNSNVEILPLRGNIDTRLRKVESGTVDCAIVAYCGFLRMGWHNKIKQVLDDEFFIPAPSQGAIAVECRADSDSELKAVLKTLNNKATEEEVFIEREFVRLLGGGCNVPLGVRAKVKDDKAKVVAGLFSPNGENSVIVKREIKKDKAKQILEVKQIVDELLEKVDTKHLKL